MSVWICDIKAILKSAISVLYHEIVWSEVLLKTVVLYLLRMTHEILKNITNSLFPFFGVKMQTVD